MQARASMIRASADEAMEIAIALRLHERITVRDRLLLERCWIRQNLDSEKLHVPVAPDAHQILWLVHYGLLSTRIDKKDTIWLLTTRLGRDMVCHIKRKKSSPQGVTA